MKHSLTTSPVSLVITDLDGTLGASDAEIREALTRLSQLGDRFQLCIITGKSLRSLSGIEPVIQPGTLIAPWGGGNLFSFGGHDYTQLGPRRVVTIATGIPQPTYIAIPKRCQIACKDELHVPEGDLTEEVDAVSAYWRFEADELSSARRLARQHNLMASSGRGMHWVTMTPVDMPRRYAVRQCREVSGARRVLYLGDSGVDAECISEVDVFFAPTDSELAGKPGVTAFAGVDSLIRTVERTL